MDVDTVEVLITVSWVNENGNWNAYLITATKEKLIRRKLEQGIDVSFEVTKERRCIGYTDDTHHICPEFNIVDGGRQCFRCRRKDSQRDYIEGRSGSMREEEHSVYLAQCGRSIKVGVTKSNRLHKRWVEQGASFAVEIDNGITADEALHREQQLSESGLSERIRKEKKVPIPSECLLESSMREYSLTGDVVDLRNATVYPSIQGKQVDKTGRCVGVVNSVSGQIIEVGNKCITVTPGRCIEEPKQMGLEQFY